MAAQGHFQGPLLKNTSVFEQDTLNAFMALGRPSWREARSTLQALLTPGGALDQNSALKAQVLIPLSEVQMHLPCAIGDYTDFYASKEHATNVGSMFRGPENALMPNWYILFI